MSPERFEAARAGRAELARLIAQDPLDRTAVEAQLSAVRTADIALRTRLEKAVIDFAQTLTQAERQILVEGLRGRGAMLRRLNSGNN
ncbi:MULTISPECIES: periplasmic heavy metal sensor [unclassified Mesorhizobium]|uniref:periplasmic heavy metal sensor n=1 Tax=unclassified Mesorhizobium TaxID=325217 RepID=UPI0003CE1D39|nr:periplasmic heavy metal sensor [Mesorhizobium sp. LSHC420B00]ESX71606.1 hypothetical protein X759_21345 [Mesorhizobium sp. LSHC420B00]